VTANDSFHDLSSRLAGGDESAAREIVARYSGALVAKARQHLDPAIRDKLDAEDIVQSALGSFFRRNDDDQFVLEDWQRLWGLLVQITIRKCIGKSTYYRAERRDVARECRGGGAAVHPPEQSVTDRQPRPEEMLVLAELIDELMGQLELESHRNILALGLQGYSVAEISPLVCRSKRMVQRVLKEIRWQLEESG